MPNLQQLDLSNNKLNSLNELEKVLESCFKLNLLDIRDNLLQADLKDLISVIRKNCPNIKRLFLERSTKGKQTAVAKQYYEFVYQQFPNSQLELVDNMKHPQFYGEGPRKIKSVFSVDWNQPAQQKSEGADQFRYSIPPEQTGASAPNDDDDTPPPYGFPAPTTEDPYSAYLQNSMYGASIYPANANFYPYAQEAQMGANAYHNEPPPAFAPLQDDPVTNPALYPDLGTFTTESYLPKDYHMTIGRKYDVATLAKQLQEEREKEKDDEEEEDE